MNKDKYAKTENNFLLICSLVTLANQWVGLRFSHQDQMISVLGVSTEITGKKIEILKIEKNNNNVVLSG